MVLFVTECLFNRPCWSTWLIVPLLWFMFCWQTRDLDENLQNKPHVANAARRPRHCDTEAQQHPLLCAYSAILLSIHTIVRLCINTCYHHRSCARWRGSSSFLPSFCLQLKFPAACRVDSACLFLLETRSEKVGLKLRLASHTEDQSHVSGMKPPLMGTWPHLAGKVQ